MKVVKFLLFVMFVLPLLGCPGQDEEIVDLIFYNNSNQEIVIYNWFISGDNYELPKNNPFKKPNTLEKNSTMKFSESFYTSFQVKTVDRYMIIIFSKETLETKSWEEIREGDLRLKTYYLSLEDLEKRGWRIEYPE